MFFTDYFKKYMESIGIWWYSLTILYCKLFFKLHYLVMQYSYESGETLSSSQILKGILEGCLLSIIAKGETYGYEMIEKLDQYGFTMVKEGSIYPLLLRMKKQGLVETSQKQLPSGGPKRKYYTITENGRRELETFKGNWDAISTSVTKLMKEESQSEFVKEE